MNVLFDIFGYPLTYYEFFGVLLYFTSVYLAIRVNILTWITSIVSQIFFFIIFLQSQTYANAALQIFYIIICINGWIKWGRDKDKKISLLNWSQRFKIIFFSLIGIAVFGTLLNYLPIKPDPYPYFDMSIFVLSVVGVYLLAFKKLDTWFFWIVVNLLTILLYYLIGYYFVALQGVILIYMNIYALKRWMKLQKV